ncbi:putative metal tolerance protein C3 [Citrus sinensis]|uniref:putative metal tolerance protein C3 n=1 Tax=Citrus clementina TaxID=85681 RepID=UPI000CED7AA1|nr:putative metal tolerance protein C3 [Citrus x clementina]XP_052288784.1 putative metal tolerance protein C3 [Citrus sinensis]
MNMFLLFLKLYATMTTGSIAITASTQVAMKNTNIYKYPIGKLMVQPVGIIIFAAVMATLGLQVLIQAVEELVKDEYNAIGMVVFNHDWCFCCQTFPLDLLQELRNTIVRTYAKFMQKKVKHLARTVRIEPTIDTTTERAVWSSCRLFK